MGTLFVVILFLAYFVPAFVAHARGHRNSNAISILNLLLGWTFLGWIIALVWSCTANVAQRDVYVPATASTPEKPFHTILPTPKSKVDVKLVTFWAVLILLPLGIGLELNYFQSKTPAPKPPTQSSQGSEEPNFISKNGQVIPNPAKIRNTTSSSDASYSSVASLIHKK